MKNLFLLIILLFSINSFAQTKEQYDHIMDSLERNGQHDKIIPYFEKELKKRPKNENILRSLGFTYLTDNNLVLGEKYYNEALSVNPKCARCYINLAKIYSIKNEVTKALELANKAAELDANDAVIYAVRAKIKEQKGEKISALTDYNKAVDLNPENPENYFERGNYNFKASYFSLAISDFNKAIELFPNYAYAYYMRAQVYYEKQMLKEAMEDMNKAIQIDSLNSNYYSGRAAVYEAFGELNLAMNDYAQSIKTNPNEYYSYYHRANLKYKQENMDGYCDDIHDSYQIATKNQAPKNFISDLEYTIGIYCDTNNASYYYQRGIAYYNLTQYDKAVDIYTKGLAKKPSNSMLLSFRGNAYYIQKKYKEALADYTQSISNKENVIDDIKANQKHTEINLFDETYINGFISSMQVSMAESYFALQEYDKALEEINKGLAIAPNLKEFGKENFYNVRGTIHLALGNYNSALADFDTCILLNNAEPFLYVNRSIARTQQNKTTKIRSVSLSGGINNRTFYGNWLIPITKDKDKNTSNLLLALKDCNKAIEQDKNLAEAYYIKAIIEKQLGTGDYCSDLKKAQNLGYTIEAEWLKECR